MARKSLTEEIGIIRRYAELTEPFFKVIKANLNSKDIERQQWAVERLEKAFVKMIPQTLDGLGENGEIQIQIVRYSDSNPTTAQLSTKTLPASAP